MQRCLFAGVGLLSLVAAAVPVFAAELPVSPRPRAAPARAPAPPPAPAPRPVAQAPAQAAPNWSGTQVGGFNGASNMSNAMVEPGAFLFFAPTIAGSFSLASSGVNTETPYSFKGNPWSYTAGGFLGYNVQLGSYVIGAESDVAWKNGSSGSNQFTITPANYAPLFGFGPGTTAYRAESFNGTLKQTWDSSLRSVKSVDHLAIRRRLPIHLASGRPRPVVERLGPTPASVGRLAAALKLKLLLRLKCASNIVIPT
jgi:hypothetical protein